MTEADLIALFKSNATIEKILTIISEIEGVTCYLAAGTLRNFVWDCLAKKESSHLTDVDIIFFDTEVTYEETCQLEERLRQSHPTFDWEVKNQVYMHQHNPKTAPYANLVESLSAFPETCTAIALRKVEDRYELLAPHGIADLVAFEVRPTEHFMGNSERLAIYRKRVIDKQWQNIWPRLRLYQMA
ncbi:nucleotidyltransferase family protein [Vagococcus sp. BWB3-3]|uniref:Nucleotidyltransferase family protein n=1 Tax=Vagococcus allomyrinae TaxID=2794353 RepID=A0A940P3W6_9ENTE|nr:nucleotidyltransferase family protein [Vagococcus allomyrinae]MBP1040550.1 nucleotidyltransferase family protein [Vagococcus allomyrinae]